MICYQQVIWIVQCAVSDIRGLILFRKMEQLVLYVKALRALNLSLLFAQGEIRVGHLKPSNAVKNGKYLFICSIYMFPFA